jgi:hypothetical protein
MDDGGASLGCSNALLRYVARRDGNVLAILCHCPTAGERAGYDHFPHGIISR